LISEHEIDPISPNWGARIADAEAHFADLQRKRFT
jgi:hypothetical protein